MYKWVISDVEGDIFDLAPSRSSNKILLLPNEHESNFMRLNSITSERMIILVYTRQTVLLQIGLLFLIHWYITII